MVLLLFLISLPTKGDGWPGRCKSPGSHHAGFACGAFWVSRFPYSLPKLTRWQSYTASYNNAPIYSFNITSFAPNGNVLAATDTANGNWNYAYDQFNRLVCADLASNGTCAMPPAGTPTYTYVYDRFGNRWQQNGPHAFIASFTGNSSTNNNRMDGYSYDAAGNLMNDGTHQYTYDTENRITSVDNGNTATYAYDPDGNRVEKISSGSGELGDPAGTWQFLYDQSGRLLAKVEGTGWAGEVYAGPHHLATIGGGTSFNHSDWLGTFRLQTVYSSINNPALYTYCASLPFGDGLACQNTYGKATLNMRTTEIFTGKPRDFESGLDYFGARFDASSMGRFMSPDAALVDQHTEIPQSWNLYSYVRNNPLTNIDPDGECTKDSQGNFHGDDCQKDTGTGNKPDQVFVKEPRSLADGLSFRLPGSMFWITETESQRKWHAYLKAMGVKEVRAELPPLFGPIGELPLADAEVGYMAKLSGILREAASGKGNFGLGEASASEAAELGDAWVGPGATTTSDGIKVSADGLRQYRPPSLKPNLGKTQANFESRQIPSGQWQSNGHLDIK